MKRTLLWLLFAACLWEGYVYLYTRPRFWAWLALATAQVSHGARRIYNASKTDQEQRDRKWEEFNHAFRARPHTGDTITDIETYLKEHRRPGA